MHLFMLNAEKLQNPFACNADQCFEMKVKCVTGQASFWVKFPAIQNKTPVKYPGGWGVGGHMELTDT